MHLYYIFGVKWCQPSILLKEHLIIKFYMRKVFLFFLLIAFAQQVLAQQTVETRLGYSYNNEEDF